VDRSIRYYNTIGIDRSKVKKVMIFDLQVLLGEGDKIEERKLCRLRSGLIGGYTLVVVAHYKVKGKDGIIACNSGIDRFARGVNIPLVLISCVGCVGGVGLYNKMWGTLLWVLSDMGGEGSFYCGTRNNYENMEGRRIATYSPEFIFG